MKFPTILRRILFVVVVAAAVIPACPARGASPEPKMIGIYVHQHWPYNRPYAARTWTYEDWAGYLSGIKTLGYNTVLIWPVLDNMPDPLTDSDRKNIAKIARVIDHAKRDLKMRVYLASTPNVASVDIVAGQATFEERHFFHSDRRVDPGNKKDVAEMMQRREELTRPLAAADGYVIIDSDPGGYPGSTNAEFVNLLVEHRRMLDRLRPGIELMYWMHAGWPAYSRYYQTYAFKRSSDAEFEQALRLLQAANPEPWGLANNEELARKLGLESRVVNFRYGQIEGEPSFPLTTFERDRAYRAGTMGAARGVMGNAQSHCLQLPNTFAFVRGARGLPAEEADFRQFAEELIPGHGEAIRVAWVAMSATDPTIMDRARATLEALPPERMTAGPLQGLYFGDAQRYVTDLVLQLQMNAAYVRFMAAVEAKKDVFPAMAELSRTADIWQARHGYKNQWRWPVFREVLAKLSPELAAELSTNYRANTPYGKVMERYHRLETETVRILEAMRATLRRTGHLPPAAAP